MSDPDREVLLIEVTEHLDDVLVSFSGKLLVDLIVDAFDVEHDEVCVFEQFIESAEPLFLQGEVRAAGVDGDMDVLFLEKLTKFDQEVELDKRFSSTDGSAAFVLPVSVIAVELLVRSMNLTA